MKSKLSIGLLAALFLVGCATTNKNLFSNVTPTIDPSYGYAPENPISMKNGDPSNSVGASYHYLSLLRSEKGNKLEILGQVSIDNPHAKRPIVPLRNKYTGKYYKYETGPLLDVYVVKAENETDTLQLYFNIYSKDELKVPQGLRLEKE